MPHKRAKRSIRVAESKKHGFNLAPTNSSLKGDTPGAAARILNSWSVQSKFRESGKRSSEDTGIRKPRSRPSITSNNDNKESTTTNNKKRKLEETSSSEKSAKQKSKAKKKDDKIPGIQPHESLGAYNRRIEALLRPGVSSAIKSANAVKAAQAREAEEAKQERIRISQGKGKNKQIEEGSGSPSGERVELFEKKKGGKDIDDGEWKFEDRPVKVLETKALPRRFNDIVQAPPKLPKLKAAVKADKRSEEASGWAGAGEISGGSLGTGMMSSKKHGKIPLNAGQQRLMELERERVIKQYREIKAARYNKVEEK